jgi:hypothetical protein
MAEFIRLYTTRNARWRSPKYLCGESYGVFRAAGLAAELQDRQGMFLNGLVLVSGLVDYGTIIPGPSNDLPYSLFLPSFTAVAHAHGRLPEDLQADRARALAEAEAGRQQVAQPVHAVQGDGEAAVGAGAVERVALGPHRQLRSGQVEDAAEDLAATLELHRPQVAGIGGQTVGSRPGDGHGMEGRAEPLALQEPARAFARGLDGERGGGRRGQAGRVHGAGQPPLRAAMLPA